MKNTRYIHRKRILTIKLNLIVRIELSVWLYTDYRLAKKYNMSGMQIYLLHNKTGLLIMKARILINPNRL